MRLSLRYAILITLISVSETSAQTVSVTAPDFNGVGGGRTITVIEDSGTETIGKLVRFTPDALTLAVSGRDVVFERARVASVVERGDSLKNGTKIGFLTGAALGGVIGIAIAGVADCGGRACNAGENLGIVALPGAFVGLIGAGIGAGVDALISRRQIIYQRRRPGEVQGGVEDFTGLLGHRAVIVVDGAGVETRGRLLRFGPEAMTVVVKGKDVVFDRQRVAAVFERGDSVRNGARNGFLAGAAVGIATGVSKTQCGRDPVGIGVIQVFMSYEPCTGEERMIQGVGEGALLGLIGAGIGAGVDALISGRRLLYQRPKGTNAPVISLVPSVAPSRASFHVSVSW